ncbi:MAG: 4Fe-4S binding protein [Spirochaetes bacterium]|nr:4Fe-4S binding protein [Spirochaetota bacterium]
MKRDIIKIDEKKCTGCGLCVPGCPEGALQIIDGKARLVSDLFCDGLGACIGECPEGAITIETREAEEYDEKRVMKNVVRQGSGTIKAHLKHLADHHQTEYLKQAIDFLKENQIEVPVFQTQTTHSGGGCPGAQMQQFQRTESEQAAGKGKIPSALNQWPVQLALLSPDAPYFENAEILIAADCTAFSAGGFHQDFLAGKILVVFCPKLDTIIEQYIEKLTAIFSRHQIRSINIVRMMVPCCSGTTAIVQQALQKSNKEIKVKETVLSLQGEVIKENEIL